MSITDIRRPGLMVGMLAPLACLLVDSCGSGRNQAEAPRPIAAYTEVELPQLTADTLGDLPGLSGLPGLPQADPLAEPDRNLSFTNIVSYNGNGIFNASPQNLYPNNTTVLPSSLSEIAWAEYAFNTQGYQPERLSVDLVCNPGSVAYVGYSDYSSGHWHWVAPTTGPASFELPPGLYLNANQQFFVVVLTAGGSIATVKSLSARFDNDVTYSNSISGTILDEHGEPMASQFLMINPNPDLIQVLTDLDGSYFIGLPAAGNYDVTPQSMNAAYLPATVNVAVNGAEIGVNFTGTRIDIRGRVATASGTGVPGVALTLNPGGLMTTISGADGEYEFQGVADGAYTVDPLLAGYTFDPASQNAVVSGTDKDSVNFEATGGQPTFGIFGNIHEANLDPVPGIFVTLTPGYRLAQTDANGNYGFTGLAPATYELKPVLGDWSFAPAVKQVNISGASENGADFIATPPPPTYTVSGRVIFVDPDNVTDFGIPNIFVQLTDKFTATPVYYQGLTDSNGNFTINGVLPRVYYIRVKGFGYPTGFLQAVDVNNVDKTVLVKTHLIDGPTWENFTASYVSNACNSCHRPDSQTAVDPPLRNYTEVVNAGSACNARIQSGTMPPGNPSLPINKLYFKLWREAGYPLD